MRRSVKETEELNKEAQKIVRAFIDMVDFSMFIDPREEMSDEKFEYLDEVCSAILQRAEIPPKFIPLTWLCPYGCSTRVWYGKVCGDCTEESNHLSTQKSGIGVSEIANEDK